MHYYYKDGAMKYDIPSGDATYYKPSNFIEPKLQKPAAKPREIQYSEPPLNISESLQDVPKKIINKQMTYFVKTDAKYAADIKKSLIEITKEIYLILLKVKYEFFTCKIIIRTFYNIN